MSSSPRVTHADNAGGEAAQPSPPAAGGERGVEAAAGDGGSGGTGDATALFGEHTAVESAATDCTNPEGATPTLVLPAGSANPVYDRLGAVGNRRFAFSREARTLFTFDPTGNVSSTLNDVAAVASNGAELSVVFGNSEQTIVQRYDETLAAVGESVSLETSTVHGVAAAANGSQTLVASIDDDDQLAIDVWSGDVVTSSSVPLGEGEPHCALQATPAGKDFAILTACSGAPNQVRLKIVSATAKLLADTIVLEPSSPLDLAAFSATGDGFAFVLHDLRQRVAHVVQMDAGGQIAEPIRSISGLQLAFDLGPATAGLSLTAQLERGVSALGRLNVDGEDTWTCLDETSPGGSAALHVVDKASSVLVRHGNGSAWLMLIPQ